MSQNNAVIVAGGSGTRMKSSIPKQFLEINEVPVLVYTMRAFLAFDPEIKLVLVLPKAHFATWEQIKSKFLEDVQVSAVEGGATRYQSVKNGLSVVESGLVAIHDAVRPCVSEETIGASFEAAAETGSGIVSVAMKDSIREVSENHSKAVDRSQYRIVQTPQTFQVEKIKRAFDGEEKGIYTDDATVYEHVLLQEVTLVDGDYRNIKITTPEDLAVAALHLKKEKAP